MNTKRIITSTLYVSVVSAALALHSCAPQSNYKAPEFELPEQYRGQLDSINNTRDSVGIADIDWKTFFEDEKLIELINSGFRTQLRYG